MKKIKMLLSLTLAAIGAVLIFLGGFVFVGNDWKEPSAQCIGWGSAALALGIGKFIDTVVVKKSESSESKKMKHWKNIQVNDERNVRIREKVGAKIARVVNYALFIIVLAMGLMKVSVTAIIMVSSLFLLELVLVIVLSNYYAKRM